MCVETGVGWLVPRQWFAGDVGTGSATPPMSCAFPAPAPRDRQTEGRHSLAAALGAGSDPAVLWFGSQRQPAPLVSFAPHADLRFGQQQIVAIQREHFARA